MDQQFLVILRVAAFLAVIWAFGRILQALRLPVRMGALFAGMLLGPQRMLWPRSPDTSEEFADQ